MKEIIQQNRILYIGTSLFILLGLCLHFSLEQGAAILFFSDNRSWFWDLFFKYGTMLGEELGWYALILTFAVLRPRFGLFFFITAISVLILSYLAKSFFAHPRPYLFFEVAKTLESITFVEGVRLLKGSTSFPSGHTLSAFAFYSGIALVMKNKPIGNSICLLLALVVGISRIYLVQHFIKDIIFGAALGLTLSTCYFYLSHLIPYDRFPWLDHRLFERKKNQEEVIVKR